MGRERREKRIRVMSLLWCLRAGIWLLQVFWMSVSRTSPPNHIQNTCSKILCCFRVRTHDYYRDIYPRFESLASHDWLSKVAVCSRNYCNIWPLCVKRDNVNWANASPRMKLSRGVDTWNILHDIVTLSYNKLTTHSYGVMLSWIQINIL